MKLALDARALHRVRADLTVIVVAREGMRQLRTERLVGAAMARELKRRRFDAARGSATVIPAGAHGATRHLAIVGLGPASKVGRDELRRAGVQILARAREVRAKQVVVGVRGPATALPADGADAVGLLAEGALLASYRFGGYRRGRKPATVRGVTFAEQPSADARTLRRALRSAEALAKATNRSRDWINEPAGVMTPAAWAADVTKVARAAGLEVTVDGPSAISRLGMGALLGVARGSVEPPRFIRLAYRPRGRRTVRRVALVGKGITFDSGGLSLKPAGGMVHMKRDMAGGAAVLGAMLAIAKLRPAIEVFAYVPASENLPGGSAMKPGDILTTAAGTTIEVLNTDAEGRLVLADALAIAVRDQPEAIIDLATLTGAVKSALGTRVAGVMGTDAALVRQLIRAGEETGERLWELPLVDAYRPHLDSAVADLANIGSTPYGGAIHAGLFLREFVGDVPWAHLDIAGVAFTDRDLPGAPRGGVGFGVRLLVRWVCALAASNGD